MHPLKHLFVLSVLLAMFLVIGGAALAEGPTYTLQPIGQIGGSSHALAKDGHRVYLGVGTHLTVLDVSDPATPELVAESDALPDIVRDIALQDDVAYVALREGGLAILDVSGLQTPRLLGSLITPTHAVAVSGTLACIGDASGHLRVLDVSDPSAPVEMGSVDLHGEWYLQPAPTKIVLQDELAFVLAPDGIGLVIVNLVNPSAPFILPNRKSNIRHFVLDGSLAYVSWAPAQDLDYARLYVYDVSDVTSFGWVSDVEITGPVLSLAVEDGLALVATESSLYVYDVTNPSNPVRLAAHDLPGLAYDMALEDDSAFLADYACGLRVIDLSDPEAPAETGAYATVGMACAVDAEGSLAVVLDRFGNLHTVDVASAASPELVSTYRHANRSRVPVIKVSVDLTGTLAYVADQERPFRVMDLTDPAAPVEIGQGATAQYPIDVVVSGTVAYVADEGYSMRTFDVSDPSAPVALGHYDTSYQQVYNVALHGSKAYFTLASSYAYYVLDVSDPNAFSKIGHYRTVPYGFDIKVVDDKAYATHIENGVSLSDVSDPNNTVHLTRFDTPGSAVKLEVLDGMIYLADESGGMAMFDASDPLNVQSVATYETMSLSLDVAVRDGLIYVADYENGLVILRWMAQLPPLFLPMITR